MKKLISILLAVALMATLLTACGGTQNTETTPKTTEASRDVVDTTAYAAAESFAGGTGTAEDPFQISQPGHLVLLHEMLVKEEKEINFDDTYVKGNFILTADISLNDTADFENWATKAPKYGWTPIGLGVSSNSFAGVLDGNGHKITGLFMDMDGANTDYDDDYGLFAELNGTVKNLTVEKSFIRVSGNTTNVGTVAGSIFNGTVENCQADTTIALYGAANAGGLVGKGGSTSDSTFSGTITQLDDGVSQIGGIAGSIGSINQETADCITNCTFTGKLSGNGHTGGIIGFGENARGCTNKGEVSGDTAGGIVGRAYCVGTNLELKVLNYSIENCANEGTVTGKALAGGIVGWFSNDESEITMTVVECRNDGQVVSDESAGGIIGKLSLERAKLMKVENCVNNADISGKGKTGGVICEVGGSVLHQEGALEISGCKNLGAITSEDQYSAGVITYFLVMGDAVDFALRVENCENSGAIKSTAYAGGILGFSNVGFNAEANAETSGVSENTKVTMMGCSNSGAVTTTSSNSMAGGIVGVYGLGYIPAEITNCKNTGAVAVDFTLTDAQIAENQGASWTEFYQIAGGIIGRIGDALKLTTAEGVETSAANVNASNGYLTISGCSNSGDISAPDYSNILNQWEKPLYVNYLGGIVGQCSATNGYAFAVDGCTYSGAERGLGSMDYTDIGTKQ